MSVDIVGSSVITSDGINAFANASASGSSVKPKYFVFSSHDLVVDPTLRADDIDGWITKEISLYQKVDDNTVEFVCDVTPTEAIDYMRFCGLLLEDGTLFQIAKPSFPMPPSMRQTFKIQTAYENASELLEFKYVPFSEEEQSLSILDSSITIGLQTIQNAELDGLIKRKMVEVSSEIKQLKDTKKLVENRLNILEQRTTESELSSLDTNLSIGLQTIENSTEIGLIKNKIGV